MSTERRSQPPQPDAHGLNLEEILRTHAPDLVLERTQTTHFQKVILFLVNANGERFVGKLAKHAYAQRLLTQEALGYAFARRYENHFHLPQHVLVGESSEYTLALTSLILGKPLHSFASAPHTFSSLESTLEVMELREYLKNDEFSQRPELAVAARQMLSRHDGILVPVSPAHGDFVHWNLLQLSNAQFGLLDFEYFTPCRAAHADDWHWRLFPLARRLRRMNALFAFKFVVKQLAAHPSSWLRPAAHSGLQEDTLRELNRVLLGLYLLNQSRLIISEHDLPDIHALIGWEDYNAREAIAAAYLEAIKHL